MDNTTDAGGYFLCSVCQQPIRTPEPVSRRGDSMIHAKCWSRIARCGLPQSVVSEMQAAGIVLTEAILEPDDRGYTLVECGPEMGAWCRLRARTHVQPELAEALLLAAETIDAAIERSGRPGQRVIPDSL